MSAQRVLEPVNWDIKADISHGAASALSYLPTKPFKRKAPLQSLIDPADVQCSSLSRQSAWETCQRKLDEAGGPTATVESIYK